MELDASHWPIRFLLAAVIPEKSGIKKIPGIGQISFVWTVWISACTGKTVSGDFYRPNKIDLVPALHKIPQSRQTGQSRHILRLAVLVIGWILYIRPHCCRTGHDRIDRIRFAMTDISPKETWNATLGQLELEVPRATFDTWLKQTEGIAFDGLDLLVEVPSVFAVEWLEQRMYQTILRTLRRVAGQPFDVRFQVQPDPKITTAATTATAAATDGPNGSMGTSAQDYAYAADSSDAAPGADSGRPPARLPSDTGLSFNVKHSFNSFVVGNSNRMAFSAAQAVADAPGQAYNPLFLYSGVGLGKTHLLQAIGQQATRNGQTVLYVSSEQFTNEFISAIRNRTTEEFRRRYRSVHVLLIDDVQFMSGKEQTQEGFFHTFNDLHTAGYQIVLTSDRPPKALALLEDRLRSRFEWGLIADIQPPDLETRMAILAAKADALQVILEESVLELIAKRVQKNVRELEGSLNRVVAYSQLMNTPITLESTSRLLDDLTLDTARHAIDPERILEQVSRHYKVANEDLVGRSRSKTIALARQVAMYLLIYELELSPTDVGRLLGNRDHSTVIHGAGKINGEINEDYQLRQNVLTIKEAIFT